LTKATSCPSAFDLFGKVPVPAMPTGGTKNDRSYYGHCFRIRKLINCLVGEVKNEYCENY
jgi:hypothetical protein